MEDMPLCEKYQKGPTKIVRTNSKKATVKSYQTIMLTLPIGGGAFEAARPKVNARALQV